VAEISQTNVDGAVFLGCEFSIEELGDLVSRGAIVFPSLPNLPFNPYRAQLYTAESLFDGFDPGNPCTYCDTTDAKIYRYWQETGGANADSVINALARRLHDHAVTDAMNDFLHSAVDDTKIVAIMGGHSMKRSDRAYSQVARISRSLARKGYLMVSGGGPGAMEATHLGTWFIHRDDDELDHAVRMLAEAPSYKDKRWLAAAFEVREAFPAPEDGSHKSLGIPTWLYGHEPPNPFASHIAKYFANSVREDGLVTIAKGGIIFSPGSAGTIQEIFQDATQNHYLTTGLASPMVFMDQDYWTNTKPIYPILKQLSKGYAYEDQVAIFDDEDSVVDFIETHPPVVHQQAGWSFCSAHCEELA
jgi:predicted Rossmann-fold nucleotide-binding protein